MDSVRIRCPKCSWEPDGRPYWMCECGCEWDTFSYGGRCPSCKKVWEYTQCIDCYKWSPHLDWYENLDDIVQEIKEEMEVKV